GAEPGEPTPGDRRRDILEPLLLLDEGFERGVLGVRGAQGGLGVWKLGRARHVDEGAAHVHGPSDDAVEGPAGRGPVELALPEHLLAVAYGHLDDEDLVLRQAPGREAALGIGELAALEGQRLARNLGQAARLEQTIVRADHLELLEQPRRPGPRSLAAVARLR